MTRVLVVDDKEENTYYLNALLSAHGCVVESARDGAEALRKARHAPPSLVISDLLMPVMDGYTLLRCWKADELLKRVPFIVYTATYTDPEDEQLALSLGADAFILKPAHPEAFIARLRQVQRGGLAAPAASIKQPVEDEPRLLREYSQTLIRKLEDKSLQLEQTNRRLQSDIAARQQAEVNLRESEERFRQLAESIDDIFWLSDLQGHLVYVSPAYETVWGRSPASLYACPESWLEAVHPEDRQHLTESLSRYATGGWDETYRVVRPDGSLRWLRSRTYPVRDARGEVYRVAGVARDITDYRRLEDQFRQAQKMEAVGRLAGGVAHDFNNLLSVILSYTSLVLDELEPGATIREDLEQVRRAGERARDLTRQLLAFGRQQMLQPKVIELSQIVREMDKMLRRVIGEDIHLSLIASPERSTVFADPSQVEQIVMNLVVNARDAMPQGGTLAIEVANVEVDATHAAAQAGMADGPYVMLAFIDTGIGMDAATRERIFEPFFTTKEQGKGTGLGLSTVIGIVQQSHGHVQVDSEPGQGTTFKVYLPRTDRIPDVSGHELPVGELTTLRGSETILLVEDDEQVRQMTSAILVRNGYHVLVASDGDEALAASEEHEATIHLLLTDVVMPRMGGRELAERLALRREDMKVLYSSGYTKDAIIQQGVSEAELAFLQKPMAPNVLLQKIRELLVQS